MSPTYIFPFVFYFLCLTNNEIIRVRNIFKSEFRHFWYLDISLNTVNWGGFTQNIKFKMSFRFGSTLEFMTTMVTHQKIHPLFQLTYSVIQKKVPSIRDISTQNLKLLYLYKSHCKSYELLWDVTP
jgi:hypothetical protein